MRRPCEDHVYNHTRCVLPEVGEDLMEQIKCAGRAGIISYILWEWQPVQKHPCHLVTPVRQLRGSSRSSTPNGSAGAYEPQLSRPGGRPVAPRAAFPAFNQEEWAFWIGSRSWFIIWLLLVSTALRDERTRLSTFDDGSARLAPA